MSEVDEIVIDCIEQIKSRAIEHKELQKAHHFLFDKRYSLDGAVDFILMGINPGESEHDKLTWPTSEGVPLEESSRSDFHDELSLARSPARWRDICVSFLGTDRVSLTEAFFWSSKNVKELEERYGSLNDSNDHLRFCASLNVKLIRAHAPRAVIVVGIGAQYLSLLPLLYGLKREGGVTNFAGHRLVEHYRDSDGRPWIFTKHWTGAWLTAEERQSIKDYLKALDSQVT